MWRLLSLDDYTGAAVQCQFGQAWHDAPNNVGDFLSFYFNMAVSGHCNKWSILSLEGGITWHHKSVHWSKCATLQRCALVQGCGITRVCTDPSVCTNPSEIWISVCGTLTQEFGPAQLLMTMITLDQLDTIRYEECTLIYNGRCHFIRSVRSCARVDHIYVD